MILVIGATGYVGRYFCTEMVNRGIDVLALGRSAKVAEFFKRDASAGCYGIGTFIQTGSAFAG
jgi:uncharacterized protein YbjT (DUF2867 family)